MIAFNELRNAEDITNYQKQVLSRTGGRSSDNARLFHYTNINSLMLMLQSGYIWLSSPENMNDYFERELIKTCGINDLFFACFSRTNQNIAMFKMYAPAPDGVMLSITISEAKAMLSQKPLLVEGKTITSEEIETKLYWASVCYKDLDSNRISTPGQENRHLSAPLKSLAGLIKLSGWEYEKEVRLCARKRLFSDQKLAVRLPDGLKVVLCPYFDKTANKGQLVKLTANGIAYEQSTYEDWIKL